MTLCTPSEQVRPEQDPIDAEHALDLDGPVRRECALPCLPHANQAPRAIEFIGHILLRKAFFLPI